MKRQHQDFRAVKAATLDRILPPTATGGRTDMWVSGNPDVKAEGREPYAKGDERKHAGKIRRRKAGGKVVELAAGGGVKHRQDRPVRGSGRRKGFEAGGAAGPVDPRQADQDAPPPQSFGESVGRGLARGFDAISRAGRAVRREILDGPRPAYRRGGRASRS